MPELPPEPVIEPPPKSADKLDIMSRNCSELKKTLAVLQGQMNALTAEKATQETTTVTENAQPKKSKNKKNKANKSCPIKERTTGGAKAVNGKIDSNGEPIEEDNNSVVVVDAAEETEVQLETEVQPVEPTVSSQTQSDDIVNIQSTEENINGLVEDLVKDIQTNCSLESQNANDEIPVHVNGDIPSAGPECVQCENGDTTTATTKFNDDEPVKISSN